MRKKKKKGWEESENGKGKTKKHPSYSLNSAWPLATLRHTAGLSPSWSPQCFECLARRASKGLPPTGS